MVNAAAIYAASEGDTNVTTKHLEFAKDKILMGKCLCFIQTSFHLVTRSFPCVHNTVSEDVIFWLVCSEKLMSSQYSSAIVAANIHCNHLSWFLAGRSSDIFSEMS